MIVSVEKRRRRAERAAQLLNVAVGASLSAALALFVPWRAGRWQLKIAENPLHVPIVLAVLVLLWTLLTALVARSTRVGDARGARSTRRLPGALGYLSAMALLAYAVAWLVATQEKLALARVAHVSRSTLALLAGAVLVAWPLGRLWSRGLRGVLARGLRRSKLATGLSMGWDAAFAVSAVALVGVVWALGVLPDRPRRAGKAPEAASPTRHLLFFAVDGISQRQLAYWSALRPRSTLATLAETGSSAYFVWRPGQVGWKDLVCGVPGPRDAHRDRLRERAVGGLREALPWLPRSIERGKGIASERPPFWSVAASADSLVSLIGWNPPLSKKGQARTEVVLPGAYRTVRELLDGNARLAAAGIGADPASLFRLREEARYPWESWRRGAVYDKPEQDLLRACAELDVDAGHWWEDRFRLNVSEIYRAERPDLLATYLDFPRWLSARVSETDPESGEKVDLAAYAYLDLLDARLDTLYRSMRLGETLVVVFAPSLHPGPQPEREVATVFCFGERIGSGAADAGTLQTGDVSQTLFYLAGVPLARDVVGGVAWSLLTPSLESTLPPRYVGTYRGAAAAARSDRASNAEVAARKDVTPIR